MNRSADIAIGLADHLTFQHPVTRLDHGFGGRAHMLMQRHDQARREQAGLDRALVGFSLVANRLDAAMKWKQRAHAASVSTTGQVHFQVVIVSATGCM